MTATTEQRVRATEAAKFSLAYVLSAFGYEFMVFVMTVYVYDLTGSALNVGAFTAMTFLPRILSPYYGSLADRYPRERVFFVAAMGVAACIVLIGAARTIAWTYAVWLVVSLLAMIIMNVRTAIMTELLPKNDYLHGNSIMLVSLNVAKLVAPMVGGVVAARGNVMRVLQFTCAVYVVAACLGLATRLAPVAPGTARSAGAVFAHLREGARYLLSNRDLRYLGAVAFLWRLCLSMQAALFIVYVKGFLGQGSAGYGIFMTVVGVGSLLGSALGPRLALRFHRRKLIFWGLVGHYTSFAFLGATRDFTAVLLLAAVSFTLFYATVVSIHSVRDLATPLEYRGRVYGCITAILTPAAISSILVGSYLASVVGVEKVMIGGGMLAVAGVAAAQARLASPALVAARVKVISDSP